jgi:hypothetical protein
MQISTGTERVYHDILPPYSQNTGKGKTGESVKRKKENFPTNTIHKSRPDLQKGERRSVPKISRRRRRKRRSSRHLRERRRNRRVRVHRRRRRRRCLGRRLAPSRVHIDTTTAVQFRQRRSRPPASRRRRIVRHRLARRRLRHPPRTRVRDFCRGVAPRRFRRHQHT